MKSTYCRLIKILSCSLVIAAVLLCSVCMPALAASWTTLVPADHISNVYYEGNIRNVVYDFGKTPIVYYSTTGTTSQSGSFYSSLALPIDGQVGFPISYGIYPLGVYSEPTYPLTHHASGGIAIDVSDFKSEAVLSLSTNFHVNVDFGYRSEPINADEPYSIVVSWSFMQYSGAGDYLGFLDGRSTTYRVNLQNVDDYFAFEYDVYNSSSFKLPSSDVAYIIPLISVNVSCAEDADTIHVVALRFEFEDFTITTDTDMLLKESLTLEAIEGELGELNDKADTIISGTDEMVDQSNAALNESQDLEDQLDDAIAKLKDIEDISDQFTADNYKNFSAVVEDVRSWLGTRSWTDFISLVQPIMEFPPLIMILTMLVALINFSVLFFGR